MVKMSDKALKHLIRYFEDVDEPTVIVFFGDHLPDLDDSFYDTLLGEKTENLEGEALEQLYKVPFLIWANYDIEEQTIERTSNNYLGTYLAEVAGLEKTALSGVSHRSQGGSAVYQRLWILGQRRQLL